jgi:hypothetical protein
MSNLTDDLHLRFYRALYLCANPSTTDDNVIRIVAGRRLVTVCSCVRSFTQGLTDESPNLIVIKSAGFSKEEIAYPVFMAHCLAPKVPVVLVAASAMHRSTMLQFLNYPTVLEVVVSDDQADSPLDVH